MSSRTIDHDGKDRLQTSKALHQRLEELAKHGWACESPKQFATIEGTDKEFYRCVWCDGLLFGVPRSIYLSIDCGRVMLIGEKKDVAFERFIEFLGMDQDPDDVKPVEVVDRQKSLF